MGLYVGACYWVCVWGVYRERYLRKRWVGGWDCIGIGLG